MCTWGVHVLFGETCTYNQVWMNTILLRSEIALYVNAKDLIVKTTSEKILPKMLKM